MSCQTINDDQNQVATAEHCCSGTTYTPRVDIVETESELRLYADLPGVVPQDLDVRYENGELTLVGKVARRHEGVEHLLTEYGVGDFYRSYHVSEAVDAENISAELNHGVLTVHLPKTEAVKPQRIEVRSV
ncbi:MAG: Hsp20/alpha crystallin family protein [Pirellulales bacterium]